MQPLEMRSVDSFDWEEEQLERAMRYAVYFRNTYSFCRTITVVRDMGDSVMVLTIAKPGVWMMPKKGFSFYPLRDGLHM